jgi:8-oxo-dGTP diphosphatase
MKREYPAAPIAGVGVVVLRDSDDGNGGGVEVLLIQPSRGRWSLPGGVVELGERVREAAIREVREECGIEVRPDRLIEVLDAIRPDEAGRIQYHYILIDILAEYQSGELTPSSDAQDARWFKMDELTELDVPDITVRVIHEAVALREKLSDEEEGLKLWQREFW